MFEALNGVDCFKCLILDGWMVRKLQMRSSSLQTCKLSSLFMELV